jgi:hypothetical protein
MTHRNTRRRQHVLGRDLYTLMVIQGVCFIVFFYLTAIVTAFIWDKPNVPTDIVQRNNL